MTNVPHVPMIDLSSIGHKFTVKQFMALKYYMASGNKYRAYCEAYDSRDTTPEKHIRHKAGILFGHWYMKAAVELIEAEALKKMNAMADEIVVDAAWVLKRASLLADFNIKKFITVDDQGNAVYDFSTATDDDWYCISDMTIDEVAKGKGDNTYFVDRIKIKSIDKLRALELVGRHVSVAAFKEEEKTPVGDMAELLGKLIDRLPD